MNFVEPNIFYRINIFAGQAVCTPYTHICDERQRQKKTTLYIPAHTHTQFM